MRKLQPWGALLLAALPLFCEGGENRKVQEILRFTLQETPEEIAKLIGRPSHVDDSVPGYQSWQYEPPPEENGDDNSAPAWFVCLRTGTRQVVSITRNFDKPQDVDALFPMAQTMAHHWPSPTDRQFSVRVRRISEDALLLGMGTAKAGERTSQLILIRRSALKTFLPWLAEQIE
jgi:hypothetical protein